jgi:hypothetical protein
MRKGKKPFPSLGFLSSFFMKITQRSLEHVPKRNVVFVVSAIRAP